MASNFKILYFRTEPPFRGEPPFRRTFDSWSTVAQCPHMFCYHHAKEWFAAHDDCPICCNGPVKIVKMNFARQMNLVIPSTWGNGTVVPIKFEIKYAVRNEVKNCNSIKRNQALKEFSAIWRFGGIKIGSFSIISHANIV